MSESWLAARYISFKVWRIHLMNMIWYVLKCFWSKLQTLGLDNRKRDGLCKARQMGWNTYLPGIRGYVLPFHLQKCWWSRCLAVFGSYMTFISRLAGRVFLFQKHFQLFFANNGATGGRRCLKSARSIMIIMGAMVGSDLESSSVLPLLYVLRTKHMNKNFAFDRSGTHKRQQKLS